ncbi:MAG: aldehyde dehydrogenase family protein [Porticoccaceae bacterium]
MSKLDQTLKTTIDRVFAEQQCYSLSLRSSTCEQRLAVLEKFERVFKSSFDKLYKAAYEDFSKPESEVNTGEILSVLSELKHVRKYLRRWMKPTRVRPTAAMIGTKSKILYEPKGVTLIISPWNYPFNLSFGPMIWSIAAGNTVILKPSEMTPAMSAVIQEIVEQAFDSREVCVFQGNAEVASYLTEQPFNHIYFTGSPAVGKQVMAAAAKNLASVTLELGGKSPVIVDRSADLNKAAKSICFGKLVNNGQTCIAPDYVYVHSSVKDKLMSAMLKAIESLYGPLPNIASNPDYCRVVNQSHYQRIKSLLDNAEEQGAKVFFGGETNDQQRFIAPTLLTDIPPESDIMQQEIFGPLLPVMEFEDIATVIDQVNNNPKPLALYVFSADDALTNRVLQQTSAGDSAINATVIHAIHQNLPFGGVNNSGMGKSGGVWGFQAFSHQRSVVEDKLGLSALLSPPYTAKVKRLIRAALKFLS